MQLPLEDEYPHTIAQGERRFKIYAFLCLCLLRVEYYMSIHEYYIAILNDVLLGEMLKKVLFK